MKEDSGKVIYFKGRDRAKADRFEEEHSPENAKVLEFPSTFQESRKSEFWKAMQWGLMFIGAISIPVDTIMLAQAVRAKSVDDHARQEKEKLLKFIEDEMRYSDLVQLFYDTSYRKTPFLDAKSKRHILFLWNAEQECFRVLESRRDEKFEYSKFRDRGKLTEQDLKQILVKNFPEVSRQEQRVIQVPAFPAWKLPFPEKSSPQLRINY